MSSGWEILLIGLVLQYLKDFKFIRAILRDQYIVKMGNKI